VTFFFFIIEILLENEWQLNCMDRKCGTFISYRLWSCKEEIVEIPMLAVGEKTLKMGLFCKFISDAKPE